MNKWITLAAFAATLGVGATSQASEVICKGRVADDARNFEVSALRFEKVFTGRTDERPNPSYNPSREDDSWNQPTTLVPVYRDAWVLELNYISDKEAFDDLDTSTDRRFRNNSITRKCELKGDLAARLVGRNTDHEYFSTQDLAKKPMLVTERASGASRTRIRVEQVCYVHPTDREDDRTYWDQWQKRCIADFNSKALQYKNETWSEIRFEISI